MTCIESDQSDGAVDMTQLEVLKTQIKVMESAINQLSHLSQILQLNGTALTIGCLIFLLILLVSSIDKLIATVRRRPGRRQHCSDCTTRVIVNSGKQAMASTNQSNSDCIPKDINDKIRNEYDLKFKNFIHKTSNVKRKLEFV